MPTPHSRRESRPIRSRDHTAGGFPALKSGEDWALISSLVEHRGDVRWAGSARVVTSARWQTTIEDGFAVHLAELREQCCAEAARERIPARINAWNQALA